jgi:hypothetical protein
MKIHLQRIVGAFVSSAYGASIFYQGKVTQAKDLTMASQNDDRDRRRFTLSANQKGAGMTDESQTPQTDPVGRKGGSRKAGSTAPRASDAADIPGVDQAPGEEVAGRCARVVKGCIRTLQKEDL